MSYGKFNHEFLQKRITATYWQGADSEADGLVFKYQHIKAKAD